MTLNSYSHKGVVYIPTVVRFKFGSMDSEPVEVVPVDDTEAFEQALRRTLERGNPTRPSPTRENLSRKPVVLEYSKVKTWSAFIKSARGWSIEERNGTYTIAPYKNATDHKGWVVDKERGESLPLGATIDDVVKRTIERVQSSASE
jgi:hypothetical protein